MKGQFYNVVPPIKKTGAKLYPLSCTPRATGHKRNTRSIIFACRPLKRPADRFPVGFVGACSSSWSRDARSYSLRAQDGAQCWPAGAI